MTPVSNAVLPTAPGRTATAEEVGIWISSFAPAYAPYLKSAIDNHINGGLLHDLAQEPVDTAVKFLQCAGISNALHQRYILQRAQAQPK